MTTHLIYAKGVDRNTGERVVQTICHELITEDHPDFEAAYDIEPDYTANFFATLFDQVPDICEKCRREIMTPKTIHIESKNGMTYCGLRSDEVWTGGAFSANSCRICSDTLIAERVRSRSN